MRTLTSFRDTVPGQGYPSHLDASTWLTRARRALAMGGNSYLRATVWDTWASGLPLALRRGSPAFAETLDTLVADISNENEFEPAVCDLRLVDTALCEAFRALHAHRRAGDGKGVRRSAAQVAARLVSLCGGRRTLHDLGILAGLDPSRAVHMSNNVTPSREYRGDPVPEGTMAHAAGALEAVTFRLATRGHLGGRGVAPTWLHLVQ